MTTETGAAQGPTHTFLHELAAREARGFAIQSIAMAEPTDPTRVSLVWAEAYAHRLRYRLGRLVGLETVPDTAARIAESLADPAAAHRVIVAANLVGEAGRGDPETILNARQTTDLGWNRQTVEATVRRETLIAWYAHQYVLPYADPSSDLALPDSIEQAAAATAIYGDLTADIATHLLRADDHLAIIFLAPKAMDRPVVYLHQTYAKLVWSEDRAPTAVNIFAPHGLRELVTTHLRAGRYPVASAFWSPGGTRVEHHAERLKAWGFVVDPTVRAAQVAFEQLAEPGLRAAA